MKKLYLLFLLIIAVIPLQAEDTIRNVIITEWRGDGMTNAYLELTNVDNAPVDLSKFTLATIAPAQVYFLEMDRGIWKCDSKTH